MPGTLRITYVKSSIGYSQRQKDTVRSLGLRRLHQTVELPDNQATRGMIRHVRHLVKVQEDAAAGTDTSTANAVATGAAGSGAAGEVSPGTVTPRGEASEASTGASSPQGPAPAPTGDASAGGAYGLPEHRSSGESNTP